MRFIDKNMTLIYELKIYELYGDVTWSINGNLFRTPERVYRTLDEIKIREKALDKIRDNARKNVLDKIRNDSKNRKMMLDKK